MAGSHHIVFMNIAQTGHMNPTLPLVADLTSRGCKVTYFVDSKMRSIVESAGAMWHPFRYAHAPDLSGFPEKLDEAGVAALVPMGTPEEEYESFHNGILYWTECMLPALLEDMRALMPPPAVVVYEPILAGPRVAAHVLGIPAVGMFTMPGPGCFNMPDQVVDELEAKPWVQLPRQRVAERYGIDLFKDGLVMETYSPLENLVTTIPELCAPPATERQMERFGHFRFSCVGALMDKKVKRIANAHVGAKTATEEELLMDKILGARKAGLKVLFISLGTVATKVFWERPFGDFALANDLPGSGSAGRRSLAQYNGKEFCQHVWRTCFDVFGGDKGLFVVMSLGPQQDALQNMPPTPSNFLVCDAVPQLEVLPLCDAFLTHGGANSMHEALSLGVPLAVVPIFGDQPVNADTIARTGAGISFRHPLVTLSDASLRSAMDKLMDESAENPFRAAAQATAKRFKDAGGVVTAVDIILKHASPIQVDRSRLGGC